MDWGCRNGGQCKGYVSPQSRTFYQFWMLVIANKPHPIIESTHIYSMLTSQDHTHTRTLLIRTFNLFSCVDVLLLWWGSDRAKETRTHTHTYWLIRQGQLRGISHLPISEQSWMANQSLCWISKSEGLFKDFHKNTSETRLHTHL